MDITIKYEILFDIDCIDWINLSYFLTTIVFLVPDSGGETIRNSNSISADMMENTIENY